MVHRITAEQGPILEKREMERSGLNSKLEKGDRTYICKNTSYLFSANTMVADSSGNPLLKLKNKVTALISSIWTFLVSNLKKIFFCFKAQAKAKVHEAPLYEIDRLIEAFKKLIDKFYELKQDHERDELCSLWAATFDRQLPVVQALIIKENMKTWAYNELGADASDDEIASYVDAQFNDEEQKQASLSYVRDLLKYQQVGGIWRREIDPVDNDELPQMMIDILERLQLQKEGAVPSAAPCKEES